MPWHGFFGRSRNNSPVLSPSDDCSVKWMEVAHGAKINTHTHTMDLAASDCKIINLVRNLIGCQIMTRHTARASFARLNLYAKFVSWHLEFHHFFQLNVDRTQSTFFKFLHFRQSLDNYFIISHSLCTTNLNNCFDKNVVWIVALISGTTAFVNTMHWI